MSCAKETPVKFVVRDVNNEVLCSLPLCRECSDAFASDRIDILKRKFEAKKEKNASLLIQLKLCKSKIAQMNKKSHNHKAQIAGLMSRQKEA